ncbi:hypothetical protein V1511DRAFT_454952 [Dipodascopsis uninucleata]
MGALSFADALSSSPDLFAHILPKTYFEKYLGLDPPLRPSLRSPLEFRSCTINTSPVQKTLGSALARIGESIAVCGITGYIIEKHELKNNSTLYTNIEIAGRVGPPTPELMCLSEWMYETAETANLFDPAQLNIKNSSQTLVLQAHIQLFSSMRTGDVAWAALLSALANTKIPTVLPIDEDMATEDFTTRINYKFSTKDSIPLKLNYKSLPWCSNFGVMEETGLLLADLEGRVEEASVEGRVTLVIAADDDDLRSLSLCSGKSTITRLHLEQCMELAKKRSAELDRALNKALNS